MQAFFLIYRVLHIIYCQFISYNVILDKTYIFFLFLSHSTSFVVILSVFLACAYKTFAVTKKFQRLTLCYLPWYTLHNVTKCFNVFIFGVFDDTILATLLMPTLFCDTIWRHYFGDTFQRHYFGDNIWRHYLATLFGALFWGHYLQQFQQQF